MLTERGASTPSTLLGRVNSPEESTSSTVVVASVFPVSSDESSVAVAVGAVSIGSVDSVVDTGSGGVSASIVVSVAVVAGSVSEVSDSSSISSSVTISVVVVGVVTGEVVGEGVVGGVAVIEAIVVVAVEVVAISGSSIEAKSDGLNFSGGTSGDLGGCFGLGTVGGESKKCSGERFHGEFNSDFRFENVAL